MGGSSPLPPSLSSSAGLAAILDDSQASEYVFGYEFSALASALHMPLIIM